MIEQQYYTRERGGLFGQSDGYDSIAKSEGLSLEFIKKNIHPLCSYDIPNEWQKTGEADEEKYPSNFIVHPLASGELIVGQAAYKSKDFTGLRSAFFMHNYVLSKQEKRKIIQDPIRLFGITHFAKAYDISLGKALPALKNIPFSEEDPLFQDKQVLFQEIGLTEVLFKKLLYATYMVAMSKKKLYICLNVPIQNLNRYAKALLYHMYKCLPVIILEDLGVSTYSRAPEAKKNLHIMFVEKGSIKPGDTKVEKEFVFDFVSERFLNVDVTLEKHPYFKFAMQYGMSQKAWELFNTFAAGVTLGMAPEEAKSLELYNRLAVLFEMEICSKSEKVYTFEKSLSRQGFITTLLSYIERTKSQETKERLSSLMAYGIQMLVKDIDKGQLLQEDELKAILKFKCYIKPELEELMQILIQDVLEALKLKDEKHIKSLLNILGKEEKVYKIFFNLMYGEKGLREKLCYKILRDTLSESANLDPFIRGMNKLSLVEDILIEDTYYKELVHKRFKECLHKEGDKVKLLAKIESWCKTKNSALYEELLYEGEDHVLEHLNLNTLPSEQTLMQMHFKYPHKKINYEVIEGYKDVKNHNLHVNEGRQGAIKIQDLIKRFYKHTINEEDFYMLEYAFTQSTGTLYGQYEAIINFQDAFAYLYNISAEKFLEFILWTKKNREYALQNSFDKYVVTFFKELQEKGGKVPKDLIKAKLEGHENTNQLYIKIRDALQPKWLRFIRHNPRLILAYTVLVILIIGAGSGGYIWYSQINEPNTMPLPTPEEAEKMLVEKGMFFTGIQTTEMLMPLNKEIQNK